MSATRSAPYRYAARRVLRWIDWYTRDLDAAVAASRRDEIASDLYEHAIDADRSSSTSFGLAATILLRLALGAPADLSWRRERLRSGEGLPLSTIRLRSTSVAMTFMAIVLAGLLALSGGFTSLKTFVAVATGFAAVAPAGSVWIVALTGVSIAAFVLLWREHGRWLGAAFLAVAAAFLPSLLVAALWSVSATGNVLANTPGLAGYVFILSTGLTCFAIGAAIWWFPSQTSERSPV